MPKPPKPVTDEIATVENDIYQDYIGKVQVNPDKVLRSESGGKGIELYEDLLRDDQVGSNLQTRKLAVVGKEWDVTPASEKRADQKIADFVKEVLLACNYDDARKTLLSGIVLGFKPAEIMWEYSEGQVWIKEIIGKASRRFTFDLERNLRLLTIRNMIEGEEVPDRKFIVYTSVSDNGSPFGDGLGRLLYWPVWFKKHAIKFWMIFADKFGSPTAIGKYPPGTPQAQQDDLLSAIDAIQQESAIKIPDNVAIEFLEATRTGSVNTYENLCTFMNAAISKVLLGQTLTTEIGSTGSYAASQTHETVREDYIKADADSLSAALNAQLVRWIVDYNFPGITAYPKVWIRTEPEKDLKPLADRDKLLIVDMGVPVGTQYIYDTYGIPKPEDSEELITAPKPENPFSSQFPSPLRGAESRGLEARGQGEGDGRTRNPMSFSDPSDAEDSWVRKYVEAVKPHIVVNREDALNGIEDWLKSLPSPPDEQEFTAHIQAILGDAYSGVPDSALSAAITAIYNYFRNEGSLLNVVTAFGGADARAVEFLSRLDNFYVSKFITNPEAQSVIMDFLEEHYHQGGANLFGRTSATDIRAFRDLLAQKLADLEDWQIQRIVDSSVQRIRNWSHLEQMHQSRIRTLEIVEPTQECAFCAQMNGVTIPVPTAYQTMLNQRAMSPQDYDREMKRNTPVEENRDKIIAAGVLPPYHPHCHGKVVMHVG